MSQRGSFVTEYIDCCSDCLNAAKEVLIDNHKYLSSIQLPSWANGETHLPVIAGKLGGMYPGEEIDNFCRDLAPLLAAKIRHPIRIAVLAEIGQEIITVAPTT